MEFKKSKTEIYLHDTKIENLFVSEYMPQAPEHAVKVYLYGLMCAEYSMEISPELMASQLGLTEAQVDDAWSYWEGMGAVKRHFGGKAGIGDYSVEFESLREQMYAEDAGAAPETDEDVDAAEDENPFGDPVIRKMFRDIEQIFGRTISPSEYGEMISWVRDEHISPELVTYAVEYCAEKGKDRVSYIAKVVRGWKAEGIASPEQARTHIDETDERYYRYRRVLKALGFNRNATENEMRMMDSWFDGMGYSMERVLEACGKTAGIANPNFNYVNKVLLNWKSEADRRGDSVNRSVSVSQSTLNKYYDYLRDKEAKEAEERTREVYEKIPEVIKLDEEIGKIGSELSKLILKGSDIKKTQVLKNRIDSLLEERAVVLTENDYDIDYTEVRYLCDKCRDTGITEMGERCSCVNERMQEAQIWSKGLE